jgi:hypothetical protein
MKIGGFKSKPILGIRMLKITFESPIKKHKTGRLCSVSFFGITITWLKGWPK